MLDWRSVGNHNIGRGAWIIALDMKSLRWEVDGLEGCAGFARRQFLLTSSDRPLQRGRVRAVDPYCQIEMVAMVRLEQEDSFEQHDVDFVEGVKVLAVRVCGFFGEICF